VPLKVNKQPTKLKGEKFVPWIVIAVPPAISPQLGLNPDIVAQNWRENERDRQRERERERDGEQAREREIGRRQRARNRCIILNLVLVQFVIWECKNREYMLICCCPIVRTYLGVECVFA